MGFRIISSSPSPSLVNEGADIVAVRDGAVAQTFRVYNTYTDGANYERATLTWAANVAYLAVENAGSGSNRDFHIRTNGSGKLSLDTNGTDRWNVTNTGHFIAATDNSFDIGASGATRPRNLFLAGGITHGAATLLTTTTALTNGAAAATGTLTNAPAAGNPTKWVPINDNGTTRYIPAW